MRCYACHSDSMTESILPSDELALDYTPLFKKTAMVLDWVIGTECSACHERTTRTPDLEGLVRAIVQFRCITPNYLDPGDLHFLRTALDLTGRKFAKMLGVTPVTLSRWETQGQIVSPATDKLIRHCACSLLGEAMPGDGWARITRLEVTDELIAMPYHVRKGEAGWECSLAPPVPRYHRPPAP